MNEFQLVLLNLQKQSTLSDLMLTHDFEIETLSFSEVHIHSTTPTSSNYFQTSQKLITTHNNNSLKCIALYVRCTLVNAFARK
jgi:hypothetical protein